MSTMNHEEAVRTQAAERYLLGEMNEAERDAWEAHFFSCAVCAEELKAGAGFVNAVQDFFGSAPMARVPEHSSAPAWLNWRGLLQPAPAFACALLLLGSFTIYQNTVTMARLRQPQVVAATFLTQSRSGESKTIAVPRDGRFELRIELPPGGNYSAWEGQIVSEAGRVAANIPISAQQAHDQIGISLYAGTLQPGNYLLVVRGTTGEQGPKSEIARYPFTLEFQN
ncbi:MAG TPA: hypothetical protein VKT33_05715 [Candidatus Angelobacter sp.]|nr:hypothetical protein [Candidatus Angelobacter sp.]